MSAGVHNRTPALLFGDDRMGFRTLQREDGLYTLIIEGATLPTSEDFRAMGAEVVAYDRPACGFVGEAKTTTYKAPDTLINARLDYKTHKPVTNHVVADKPRTTHPTYDTVQSTTPVTPDKVVYGFKLEAIIKDTTWYSQIFTVSVIHNNRYVRIYNIARDRKSNALHVFSHRGYVGTLPGRKRVKPAWVQKELSLTVTPKIDCIQVDRITEAHKRKRRNVADGSIQAPKQWKEHYNNQDKYKTASPKVSARMRTTKAPELSGCF